MPLRYRNGKPLYGKALQTVLAKRPTRVIVAAQPGEQHADHRLSRRLAERKIPLQMAAPPDQLYRAVTLIFSVVIIGFGLVILVVTLANGRWHRSGRPVARASVHRDRRCSSLHRPAVAELSEDSQPHPPSGSGDGGPAGGGSRWRRRLPRVKVGPGPLTGRFLGVPLQIAVAYAAIGFSLYFSIGVVAGFGLGLTPLVFLAAGVLLVLATLTYVEGAGMFGERGGLVVVRPPRVQRADQLHRRLGDPHRLHHHRLVRVDLGRPLHGADLGRIHPRLGRDRRRWSR